MEKVLLDTHAFVWWVEGRDRLSRRARGIIEGNQAAILVSAATAWELAIKMRIGKFRSRELVSGFLDQLRKEGFVDLDMSVSHAVRAGSFEVDHKDPFDRMLAAQAQLENLPLVSNDRVFDQFAVRRIW